MARFASQQSQLSHELYRNGGQAQHVVNKRKMASDENGVAHRHS